MGASQYQSQCNFTGTDRHKLDNSDPQQPEASERRLQLAPLRRVGETWEIAAAALYLASPASAFVTGHNLLVDGGTVISDGN